MLRYAAVLLLASHALAFIGWDEIYRSGNKKVQDEKTNDPALAFIGWDEIYRKVQEQDKETADPDLAFIGWDEIYRSGNKKAQDEKTNDPALAFIGWDEIYRKAQDHDQKTNDPDLAFIGWDEIYRNGNKKVQDEKTNDPDLAFIGWDEIHRSLNKKLQAHNQDIQKKGWDEEGWARTGWNIEGRAFTGYDNWSRSHPKAEQRAFTGYDNWSRSHPKAEHRAFTGYDNWSRSHPKAEHRAFTGYDNWSRSHPKAEQRAFTGYDNWSRSHPKAEQRAFTGYDNWSRSYPKAERAFTGYDNWSRSYPKAERAFTGYDNWSRSAKPKTVGRLPYIVGGEFVAEAGRWKSMCSLQLNDWHFCGASLISPDWVVTAAHCLLDYSVDEFNIACGVLDHRDRNVGSMEVHQLEYWVLHKDYEWNFETGYPNDVAVIKLKHPVNPYNPYVAPAKLAPNDGHSWLSHECYAVGWGKTGKNEPASDKLKQAKLDIVANNECTYYWGDSVNWNHICAKDMKLHNQGACNGDSGGPLFCKRGGDLYQVGVFSWMAGDCHPYWPAMYSSVPAFRDWIKQHTGV